MPLPPDLPIDAAGEWTWAGVDLVLTCPRLLSPSRGPLRPGPARPQGHDRKVDDDPESLDRVLDDAFQRQSFGPLEHLFIEEETALEEYRTLVERLAGAKDRWFAVQAALAHEVAMMSRFGTPPLPELNTTSSRDGSNAPISISLIASQVFRRQEAMHGEAIRVRRACYGSHTAPRSPSR